MTDALRFLGLVALSAGGAWLLADGMMSLLPMVRPVMTVLR